MKLEHFPIPFTKRPKLDVSGNVSSEAQKTTSFFTFLESLAAIRRRQGMNNRHLFGGRRGPIGFRIIVAALMLIVVSSLGVVTAASPTVPEATTITLYHSSTSIAGCDAVDVEIRINDVSDLYGADVRLSFDPNIVEVVDADPNTAGIQIADGNLLQNILTAKNEADNATGAIWYAVTQLNPQPPANGSGILATIRFRSKNVGATNLTFTFTQLANRNGEEIPATALGGDITTSPPAGMTSVDISMPNAVTARLTWSVVAGAAFYNIYRDSAPYFSPTPPPHDAVNAPGATYDDAGAVGDWNVNHYYVLTVACSPNIEGDISNRVGEFDFKLLPGAP